MDPHDHVPGAVATRRAAREVRPKRVGPGRCHLKLGLVGNFKHEKRPHLRVSFRLTC
jgi:hypothetical protein